jgi:hypothetical protein
MMRKWVIFFLNFFLMTLLAYSQDERKYRQLIDKTQKNKNNEHEVMPSSTFVQNQGRYQLDLNSDKIEEIVEIQKRDGLDWIIIKASNETVLYQTKLPTVGSQSVIFKMLLLNISKTRSIKTLVLFFDEGMIKSKKSESKARILLLTFENHDLRNIKLTIGPHFFHEKYSQRDQYWRRDYEVKSLDLNADQMREIIVKYQHIQRILIYKGDGIWERI